MYSLDKTVRRLPRLVLFRESVLSINTPNHQIYWLGFSVLPTLKIW